MIYVNGQWENADTLDDIIAIIREQFSEELASALKKIGTPSKDMENELDILQSQVDEFNYDNQCLENQVNDLLEENDELNTEIKDLKEKIKGLSEGV